MPILWPLALFFALIVLLVAALIGLSFVLGERQQEKRTAQPYESGIVPTGSARHPVTVKYYLVAVAFVVFDMESAYIFAWVAAFRELGWAAYVEIAIFILMLLAALVYFWRIGALNWSPSARVANRSAR